MTHKHNKFKEIHYDYEGLNSGELFKIKRKEAAWFMRDKDIDRGNIIDGVSFAWLEKDDIVMLVSKKEDNFNSYGAVFLRKNTEKPLVWLYDYQIYRALKKIEKE